MGVVEVNRDPVSRMTSSSWELLVRSPVSYRAKFESFEHARVVGEVCSET